jgi:hopanoid biosynthesis associated RND transporter like protein HpnN
VGGGTLEGRNAEWVARGIARWVALSLRNGPLVVAMTLLLCVAAGVYAYRNLGVNVDPNDLFSEDLRFQRMTREFAAHFPTLTDSLLIVVDGEDPEAARGAADALAARLQQRPDLFRSVYFPGEESFFEIHGLLYTELDDLDTFGDDMARLQPVIGQLAHAPNLATLTRVIRTGLEHLEQGGITPERWERVLDHYRRATVAVYTESPVSVPWESVLFEGLAFDPTTRRVLVAEPVLDFDRILAAKAPIEAIRAAAEELDLDGQPDVRVRVTGYPALNYEEFLGLAHDTVLAGALSFLLVIAVLFVAFRSLVVVAATAVTLLSGLVWSAGLATLTVGELNPASIAFSVLFIGLGVDFMIHLGMQVVDALRAGAAVPAAFDRGARTTGSALVLCALTTAIGFLAFLPTEYKGISELGVICAGSMVIIAFQALTVYPVLVAWWLREPALERLRARRAWSVPFPVPRHPRAIIAVALLCALVGGVPAIRSELETNVIALRNPKAESVQAFMDLLDSERGTPWYLDMLAPDLERAQQLARAARELSTVERAITLADYVPEDQDDKLEILSDVALFLDLPPGAGERSDPPDAAEQVDALRRLADFLDVESVSQTSSGLARSARLLRQEIERFLVRVDSEPDPGPALAALEDVLLSSLPDQLERLRLNLEASAIDAEALPKGLVERMLASDGMARVQVFPAEDLGEQAAMVRFVESVRPIWPDITGLPVNLVESSYVTWDSLWAAMGWALLAIALLLLLLWRNPVQAAVALVPLILAVALTAAATVVFDLPLNFVNICVLPLLLGIGVDSGIHMVHRAKHTAWDGGSLLASTTAQAVLFSAFTTLASFGTLILSDHRGIASLGALLVIGMIFTLVGNLVLLPALLVVRRERAKLGGAVGGR